MDPQTFSAPFSDGTTPLHAACRAQRADVADLLLCHGADVNAKDAEGGTPLMLAAYFDLPELLQRLIQRGADVHASDSIGYTALHCAATASSTACAALLLAYGANMNYSGGSLGLTPLHVATATMVDYFLARGALVAPDAHNWTALHYACEQGNIPVVHMLMGATLGTLRALDFENDDGTLPFELAVGSNKVEVVRLLASVSNVNREDKYGRTPLKVACEGGLTDMVDLLLELGADPTTVPREGSGPPLLSAAYANRIDFADKLRAKCMQLGVPFDVDAADAFNNTALMYGSREGLDDFVVWLLQFKNDVQRTNIYGCSALLNATRGGHYRIAKKLLECGADHLRADSHGVTPRILAEKLQDKTAFLAMFDAIEHARHLAATMPLNEFHDALMSGAITAPRDQWIGHLPEGTQGRLVELMRNHKRSEEAAFAMLCHNPQGYFDQGYTWADTVREAILLCLVPSNSTARAQMRAIAS